MYYTTTVRLSVEGAPSEPLSGVMVSLFDRDTFTPDDFLGTEMTDTHGEAHFRFTSEQYMDIDDQMGGVMPDLYVKVFDASGEMVLSTRADTVPNTARKQIHVGVPMALVEQHQLRS
jgi:hypothetical protein